MALNWSLKKWREQLSRARELRRKAKTKRTKNYWKNAEKILIDMARDEGFSKKELNKFRRKK